MSYWMSFSSLGIMRSRHPVLEQTREMVLIGSNGAPNRFVGASNSSAFEGPSTEESAVYG